MKSAADRITAAAEVLSVKKTPILIAVDGRCSAGKTTLAEYLCEKARWSVIHMDDFFLRPEQRTKERLETPGGNVDHERFLEEVLVPLKSGCTEISFRPLDCHTMQMAEPKHLKAERFCVIEGSYSCHPALWDLYDLRVFLTINSKEQIQRILLRNGKEKTAQFAEKWIPLEEMYFSAYETEKNCDMRFELN